MRTERCVERLKTWSIVDEMFLEGGNSRYLMATPRVFTRLFTKSIPGVETVGLSRRGGGNGDGLAECARGREAKGKMSDRRRGEFLLVSRGREWRKDRSLASNNVRRR